MDKSGSIAKAIVAAPTLDPVRQVEFGCEHIQEFMNSSPEKAEKLTNSYAHLNSMLAKPTDTQTTKDPKDPKKVATTILKPAYLCLQCSTISSAEDRDAHSDSKKHRWSIESRSGCLWCGLCDDFVYDPHLERLRVDQGIPTTNGKKRKLNAVYPQGEEDKFVLPNSNTLSCQAGAPRGIYNLGQTCYLSVILQAMIHNPLMRNYFLSSRHDTAECKTENCIACALTASFTEILATEKVDGHGPVEMLHKSWQNHASLAGYQQQDAHEYFQSLLDHLHNCSGCVKMKDNKSCTCLYHQIFFGKLRSTVTCLTCRNVTVAEDPIVDLSLDLRQQAHKRRKQDPKGGPGKEGPADEVTLELTQCLKNFTSPEKLIGDAYTCRSKECGNTNQKARKHLTIKKLPPTLCIQLKRYEHNKSNPQKLDTKLNFPLQLDMTPYTTRAHSKRKKGLPPGMEPADVLAAANPGGAAAATAGAAAAAAATPLSSRSPGWYDLSTVVVHVGKIDAGHYICYCRRDDQWFKFDDSKVTLATETQVLAVDAYLLFYIIRSLGGSNEGKDKELVEREREKERLRDHERNGDADADGDDEDGA